MPLFYYCVLSLEPIPKIIELWVAEKACHSPSFNNFPLHLQIQSDSHSKLSYYEKYPDAFQFF